METLPVTNSETELKDLRSQITYFGHCLASIERCANHYSLSLSADYVLSMVKHMPCIVDITKSYKDGVLPTTPNPIAELEQLRFENALLKAEVIDLRSAGNKKYLVPMENEDGTKGYYVDIDDVLYLDIQLTTEGKWSAFFKDRTTGEEFHTDQDASFTKGQIEYITEWLAKQNTTTPALGGDFAAALWYAYKHKTFPNS